ncbi:hypothetical protein NDI54_19120 [Haloarcula sp. S1AR25-5A]|uniref:Uncharacterized protein n=1 Tax=Haloarcula terrestris TaxID=2950533 RepID=A0AAE4F0B9_9EURY|nr:hypothetical protein [Haloarcula terrestris]MDS0223455.1 hypothetical protein [Haloarcula terrestris]
MSANQISLIDFNVFDFFVDIIPGFLFLVFMYQQFSPDIKYSVEPTGLFTILLLSYILGHFIQRISEFLYWNLFGNPSGFEQKLEKRGVNEIEEQYKQTSPKQTPDGGEIDSETLDYWLVNSDDKLHFQTLEAKLIYFLSIGYNMNKSIQRIQTGKANEIFQLSFTYVASQGVTGRVERFFAISNLFRSLSFLSFLLACLSIYDIFLRNGPNILEMPYFTTVPALALFVAGILSYKVSQQYRNNMYRALIADFVSDHCRFESDLGT